MVPAQGPASVIAATIDQGLHQLSADGSMMHIDEPKTLEIQGSNSWQADLGNVALPGLGEM